MRHAQLCLIHRPAMRIASSIVFVLSFLFSLSVSADSAGLSLHEAEHIALYKDPMVLMRKARSQALLEGSVADGEMADPKLRLGLYNLPLDSLSFTENPTTQLRLGVQQAFPRGDTLKYKRRRTEARAQGELARADELRRQILSKVRVGYLELYYQKQALRIIDTNKALFAQLIDITEAQYASGRVSQQDVLRAQLELLRLDDRETRIRTMQDTGRAALSKWLGDAAQKVLALGFPILPVLPSEEDLLTALNQHPRIVEESARLYAANQGVAISREQYKPGWNLGVEYRKRFGDEPTGGNRSDMAAIMLTVELPLFTENRQDRRLAASLKQAEAATEKRNDSLRELKAQLRRELANWNRAGERLVLYEDSLIENAEQNSEAALSAYQNGVSEFSTLMRARTTELNVRLEGLRVRIDRAIAVAKLLYLAPSNEASPIVEEK